MLSRRNLLRLSSLAGVVWTSPRAGAQTRTPSPPASVPASIAALKPMRDRARPFTNDERLGRIARAKKLMAEAKIDAILLAGGASPLYFANVSLSGGER